MKNYVAPQLVEFGKSTSLIKGSCNWGMENAWLDAYGWYAYQRRECSGSTCTYIEVCAQSKPTDGCTSNYQC